MRVPRPIQVVAALLFLPWFALLGWLASVAWFITDDAFISFRYVRNLVDGHGLVFNPGEYVEGYTNFLWVIELAAIWRVLGFRPEHVANWLSVIYTVGTIAVMLWWVARMPFLRHRGLIAWMALGLICGSATFAVWTSGGGLETRQFTFFVLVAVVCLGLYGANGWGLLAASLSLAAAALTRPEGLLVAACCVGWFVVHRLVTVGLLAPRSDEGQGRQKQAGTTQLDIMGGGVGWRGILTLAGPFVVLIGGHFLARFRYYGEWLPNTYYAKHVGPWYESGYRYLSAAAIETGLYLLVPLALVALWGRWRERRAGIYALVLLLVGTHMAYLFEIGGDHFEYRPMDLYWPLLAVPAAEGLARLGGGLSRWLTRWSHRLRWLGPRTLAVALFAPVLFYTSAIQGVLLFEGMDLPGSQGSQGQRIELDHENPSWLLAAPGMSALVAVHYYARHTSDAQAVGRRYRNHGTLATVLIRDFKPYESVAHEVIPSDAVAAFNAIGIASYYIPNLTVIDVYGQTDSVVARNPVTHSNDERKIAHDRKPPPGYRRQRGENFLPRRVASSEAEALAVENYALNIGDGIYLSFDVVDHDWANQRFAGLDLLAKNRFSQTDPAGNRFVVDGNRTVAYVGEAFLSRFENGGMDGWQVDGMAVSNHALNPFLATAAGPVAGHVGPGYLTTYFLGKSERTGRATSPTFTARDDQYLAFLIAGEFHDHVGMRLLADGQEVAIWRGENRQAFELVIYPLHELAGKELQLEIFNHEIGDRPRLMLDHVMLLRQESPGGP